MKKIILKKNIVFIIIAIVIGFVGASILFKLITKTSQVKLAKVKEPPSIEKIAKPATEPIPVETSSQKREIINKEMMIKEESLVKEVESVDSEIIQEAQEFVLEEKKAVSGPAVLPDLALSGVFFDKKGESFALINGRIVKEGDLIKGAKLVQILSDRVEMEIEGFPFSVRIK